MTHTAPIIYEQKTKDNKALNVYWCQGTIPGTYSLEAYLVNTGPVPVGLCYYNFQDNNTKINILYLVVFPRYKRKGIATAILDTLRHAYPDHHLVTDQLSHTGGKKFGVSYGFKELKHSWMFRKRKLK